MRRGPLVPLEQWGRKDPQGLLVCRAPLVRQALPVRKAPLVRKDRPDLRVCKGPRDHRAKGSSVERS